MYLMIQAYNVQIINTMTFILNTIFEFFENEDIWKNYYEFLTFLGSIKFRNVHKIM